MKQLYYKFKKKSKSRYQVLWKDTKRYLMALSWGSPGGAGGAGGKSLAVTRLDVIDPHLVLMMRDVMDGAMTAAPLNVAAGAGGGGGAGGLDDPTNPGTVAPGEAGQSPATTPSAICKNAAADGGAGGTGSIVAGDNYSGPGGGGGSGNGGAIVIITTTAVGSVGNYSVRGGTGGEAGALAEQVPGETPTGGVASDGEDGNDGNLIWIQV